MAAIETPITELTPVYTDPAVLQGKAVLVHDPTTGDGIVFDASKLDPSEKYQKPSTGIPKTDLAEVVQESLEKADTALQPEDIAQEKGTDEEKVMSQKAVTGIFTELQLKSGIAEGLADTLSAGTAQEIVFRKSGGDGVNYVKRFKGKTLVWNQLVQNGNFADSDGWNVYGGTLAVSNNVATVTASSSDVCQLGRLNYEMTDGHKFLIACSVKATPGHVFYFSAVPNTPDVNATGSWQMVSSIYSGGIRLSYPRITMKQNVANDTFQCSFFVILDLTLMFGAGNEPSTVEEFEAMFPLPYYPYNAGTLISNDAESLETVGFNQWDEEWEVGGITANGVDDDSFTDRWRSVGFIRVINNTSYYIRKGHSGSVLYIYEYDASKAFVHYESITGIGGQYIPHTDARYIRISPGAGYGSTYRNDICINLSDASKNGTYEPYWKRIVQLDLTTKKDTDGNVPFADGMKGDGWTHVDECDKDGGRISIKKVVFDGTENWTYLAGSFLYPLPVVPLQANSYTRGFGLTNKFGINSPSAGFPSSGTWDITDNRVGFSRALVPALAESTNVQDWKDWLAAQYAAGTPLELVYAIATPVHFTWAEPMPNSILVDELGTERAIFPAHEDGSPSAPLCTDSNYSISVKNLVAAIKNLNQA